MPDAIHRGRRLYELFCESLAAGGGSGEPWSSLGPREQLAWASAADGVVRERVVLTTDAFRCQSCGRLWTGNPPGTVHDPVGRRGVCRGSVVAVKVLPAAELERVELDREHLKAEIRYLNGGEGE